MKKLFTLLVLVLAFVACTPEETNQNAKQEIQQSEFGCSAPDTNCNGIPDHCEDENGNAIPGCI